MFGSNNLIDYYILSNQLNHYMEFETLNTLVEKGYSSYKIAKELNCSQTNVRYWLKKYGLQTLTSFVSDKGKMCPRCNNFHSPDNFYKRRKNIGLSPYCKSCTGNQTKERQQALKRKAVEYLGGKCIQCGYSKYIGALQFHHRNPDEKEFTIAHCKLYSFDKIKSELDKCDLLCANCHAEIHGKL